MPNEQNTFHWVSSDKIGEFLFTFDGKEIFNMYEDYPYKLTKEQKEIFDKENPFWADYFSYRTKSNAQKESTEE